MTQSEPDAGSLPADAPLPRSDSLLARRYRRVFISIVLPLLALVIVLGVTQYQSQRAEVLRQLSDLSANHARELDPVVDSVRAHVQLIRQRLEVYSPEPPVYIRNRPEFFTTRFLDGRPDGYTFDSVPEALRSELGQIAWLEGTELHQPTAGLPVVDMALDFFSLAREAHARNAHLQWTYYFATDPDIFYGYPWATSRAMVEDQGFESLLVALPSLRKYRFYVGGTPEINPHGLEFWNLPHIDPSGTGALVTLCSPVYVEGAFKGVIAADLRLQAMHELLAAPRPLIGRLLLVDRDGTLLADSEQPIGDSLMNVAQVLPSELGPGDIEAASRSSDAHYLNAGHAVFSRAVRHTPWTLAYVVSEREIAAQLLPNFIPYVVIGVAVTGAFLLVLGLLKREFIDPAFRLVRYIQHETRDGDAAVPKVPRLWQPWVGAVAAAFRSDRESNRKLRESESFKSAILENAMLGVVTIDPAGRIVEFNPAAERMFASTRGETGGHSFVETIVAPSSREQFLRHWSRYQHAKGPASQADRIEVLALRSDGSEIPVALSVSATGGGGDRFVTVFIADLTEQRHSEEQLARQREALRQSEKMSAMGALLAGVAHELNNPLAILMGRAALLEGKIGDPAVKDVARKIYAAAERCGRIVRTFLSMARQRPPSRKPAQLNDVAAAALELLAYGLRSGGISTATSFDPDLPLISMDADQIGQVIVNLVVNAQHALSDRGDVVPGRREIRLSTRLIGSTVQLRVADTGPGVPPELHERIFDPFFTTKPAGSGTGVGLAVSLAIAREHRGDLRLEQAASGAEFVLSLPLDSPQAVDADRRIAEIDGELFAGHAAIVDDEIEVTEVLSEILESAGFTTTRLTSGREAIAWLKAHDCDVILTDLRMPDLDGPALWRALREERPDLASRMAFITGDTLSATAEPFLKSTGLPWLEKPFTPEQVLELVTRVESIRIDQV